MDSISVLIGVVIGGVSAIIGISLKILYSRLKPYFDVFSTIKKIDKMDVEDIYNILIEKPKDKKE